MEKEQKLFYQRNMESKDPLKRVSFNKDHILQVDAYFKAKNEYRHAIICPVRFSDDSSKLLVINWTKRPNISNVYYIPFNFTEQIDPQQGLTICNTMHDALYFADTIDVLLNKETKGSWFDIGIGFFYKRKFAMIKESDWNDEYTDFLRTICDLDLNKDLITPPVKAKETLTLYDKMKDFRSYIFRKDEYEFVLEFENYKTQTKESLIKFGMIFAALKHLDNKSFSIINKDEALHNSLLEDNETPPILKSYTKVALRLDDYFKNKRSL